MNNARNALPWSPAYLPAQAYPSASGMPPSNWPAMNGPNRMSAVPAMQVIVSAISGIGRLRITASTPNRSKNGPTVSSTRSPTISRMTFFP